jgi:uncharacterized RDD family membrane protein YckC
MSGQTTPAGWYPDPEQPGQQRYWDGTSWTENRAPIVPADAPVGAPPPPAGGGFVLPPQPPAGYSPPTAYQAVGYGYAQGSAEYATFGQRLGAYLLDGLILGVPMFILIAIAGAIASGLAVAVWVLGIVGIVYYFAYFDGGETGQTIGKKQLGIKVVDATTLQPGIGIGRGAGRGLARYLSGFLCGLGYWWMLWDPDKQTWHDKIVTTKVVKA